MYCNFRNLRSFMSDFVCEGMNHIFKANIFNFWWQLNVWVVKFPTPFILWHCLERIDWLFKQLDSKLPCIEEITSAQNSSALGWNWLSKRYAIKKNYQKDHVWIKKEFSTKNNWNPSKIKQNLSVSSKDRETHIFGINYSFIHLINS